MFEGFNTTFLAVFPGSNRNFPVISQGRHTRFSVIHTLLSRLEHKHPRYFFRLPYKFPCEHILHLQARTKILQLFSQATTQFCPLKLKDFPGANIFFSGISPGYHTSFPVNRDYSSRLKHKFPRYLSVLLRYFHREYRLFLQARTQVFPLFPTPSHE